MKNSQEINNTMYMNNNNNANKKNNNYQEPDPNTLPLPERLKHQKWSARKDAYQQLIYILEDINSLQQEFDIGGKGYKINKLIPLLQNLVDQKHPVVLIEGLRCVQLILILSKEHNKSQQFIRLIDKGIQIFPLFTQQRKAILQKFLDILELSQIDPQFLKNKLSLPHQKSVMYVAEVIGALNVCSLRQSLVILSKKHPKSCVRELCAQIASQLSPNEAKCQGEQTINNQQFQGVQNTQSKQNQKKGTLLTATNQKNINTSSNVTKSKILVIDKISCYQKLTTKDQQSFSTQLLNNIAQVSQYTSAQLPNFSHILRLMIDDNNHIISTSGVKVLTYLIKKSILSNTINSLIPTSFPLLFIFNKFKLHKTHPVNGVMLELIDSMIPTTRLQDLIHAIHEGLSSIGSKANVKFGCSLSFFRILSLIYKNQNLFLCTSETLAKDFQNFHYQISMNKNIQKLIFKIMDILSKDKKYDNQIYLIKNSIGLNQYSNQTPLSINQQSTKDLAVTHSPKQQKQIYRNKSNVQNISGTSNLPKKINEKNSLSLKPGEKQAPNQKINLQNTLQEILKYSQNNNVKNMKKSIQKSSEQFFQCIRQQRYQMFYLCELIQSFISRYQPKENSMQMQIVSDYLINTLKIISFLKPANDKNQKINQSGINFLLKISLCRLSLGQEMLQILQNLSRNFEYKEIFNSLVEIIVSPFSSKSSNNSNDSNNRLKKKNKKYLLSWLQNNTPAFMLTKDYYSMLQKLKQKQKQKQSSKDVLNNKNEHKRTKQDLQLSQNNFNNENQPKLKNQEKSIKQLLRYQQQQKIYRKNTKKQQTQKVELQEQYKKYQNHQNSGQYQYQYQQKQKQKNVSKNQEFYYLNSNKLKLSQNHDKNAHANLMKECISQEKAKNNQITYSNNYKNFEDNIYIQNENQYYEQQKIEQLQNIEISKISMRNVEVQYENGESLPFTQRSSVNINDDPLALDNKWEYFLNKHNMNQTEKENENEKQIIKNITKNDHIRNSSLKKKQNQTQKEPQMQIQIQMQNSNYNKSLPYQPQPTQQQNGYKKQQIRQFFDRMKPDFLFNNQNQNKNIQQNKIRNQNIQQNFYQSQKKVQESFSQESIITDSTSKLGFSYRFLNAEKVNYMLQTTANPYPHLRTLVLIPFKSSPKKQSFLKELLHFMQELNFSKFNTPKPFESIVLLTILLFSEIKQDKGLIGPLQSLYEFVAKQSSTNQFLKIIVSLFHSVIQETLPQNRKFLITILLKSMIRMIPFVQCSLQLLRDVQQFYQIGQMVYFEMFQQEYGQIRQYLQNEALEIMIQKALAQEERQEFSQTSTSNLKMIIEGFMTTQFKKKALQKIEQFKNGQSMHEYLVMDNQQQQQQQEEDEENQEYKKYQQQYEQEQQEC